MTDDRFLGKYRIPSARLQGDCYNGGTFFVTTCTKEKKCFFGNIVMDNDDNVPTMMLSHIGQYATEQFLNVSNHYPYAEIPLFVVMPNHIHAVVAIDNHDVGARDNCRDGAHDNCRDGAHDNCRDGARPVSTCMQAISNKKGLLSVVIGGIKSSITRYANQNNIPFGWQPRFYEHIIRNTVELNRIAAYIENNVPKWQYDTLFCYS